MTPQHDAAERRHVTADVLTLALDLGDEIAQTGGKTSGGRGAKHTVVR